MNIITINVMVSLIAANEMKDNKYGDRCIDNSDCMDNMTCVRNICVCQIHYNTMQVFDSFHYYSHTECIEQAACDEIKQVPLWCVEAYMWGQEGKCDNITGKCVCDGDIAYDRYSSLSPYTDHRTIDYWSLCHTTLKSMGEYCSQYALCKGSVGLRCNKEKRKCLCNQNLIWDFTAKRCIDKQRYMEEYMLTEYEVAYGVYCQHDQECITGLVCSDKYSCECAYPCESYVKDKGSCDCGPLYSDPPVIPVTLGILLGGASVVFWCICLTTTCSQRTEDYNEEDSDMFVEHRWHRCQDSSHRQDPPTTTNFTTYYYNNEDPPPSYNEVMAMSVYRSSTRQSHYESIPQEDNIEAEKDITDQDELPSINKDINEDNHTI